MTSGDTDGRDREADGGDDEDENERHVVTVFLRNEGEVLLLKRSDAVGTYAGLWGGVSGYAEGDPDAAARWELEEETGLADAATPVRRGDPVAFTDDALGTRWVVHPFLFDCEGRGVDSNEEVAETAWVSPVEIRRRETVPELWTAYDRVRPTVASIEADTEHGSAWLSVRALEVLRDEAGLVATGGSTREGEGESEADGGWSGLVGTAEALLGARPTMTALGNRVNRAMSDAAEEGATAAAVEGAAREGIERAVAADREAAARESDRVAGERVLTLSRSGTVERALSDEGGPDHVYVAESRPAREGVGVAEQLAERGVAVTLVTDAAAAHTLAERDVDRVVVGADTVLPDGSVVNKTGTRGVALAAAHEDVLVDVVTAADKVATTATVEGEAGPREAVYDGDAELQVENPTFDRTPAAFVTGVVTERGVLDTDEVGAVAAEHRTLTAWHE